MPQLPVPSLRFIRGVGVPTPNVPNRATGHLGGRQAIYLEGLRNAPQPGQSRRCPSQVPVYRPSSIITTAEVMPVDESSIQARTTVTGVSAGTAVMRDVQGYKDTSDKRIQGWGQGLALVFLSSLLARQQW